MPSFPFPSAAALAIVRKKCAPALFAQGKQLALANVVTCDRASADECTLTVAVPGWEVAPTVVLYAEGPEWACDCGGEADPCPHVAAALLALEDARARGVPLASAAPRGHVGYRFARQGSELSLARVLVGADGRESALDDTPDGATSERTDADRAIDRALAANPWEAMSAGQRAEVLGALASCKDVRLDGVSVAVVDEPVSVSAAVRDDGAGFVMAMRPDPSVRAVLARGILQTEAGLRPVGDVDLCGERYEKVSRTRRFGANEVGELVLEVIPALARRIPVAVETKRLPPRAGKLAPRVEFTLAHAGHTLSVLPRVVYGDPPCVRIEAGRWVYLGGPVPARDMDAEVSLGHALREALGLVLEGRTEFSGEDVARFAKRLRAWDAKEATTAARSLGERVLTPRFTARDDGFDLVFEVSDDGTKPGALTRHATAAAVMHAHREGLELVPLEDGGWAPLPMDWLAKHGHLVADLVAARDEQGRVTPALRPSLAELCDALDTARPAALERLAPLASAFSTMPAAVLPSDSTGILRPYQRSGVDWLCFLREAGLGGVLADDMGLGKTLQTLCAIQGRTLVVCPRSVVHNWLDEIARFRPALRASVYHGPQRRLEPESDVTLTTYAVLRLDAEMLRGVAWNLVVLDEAQAIKNPDALASRAAYGLDARCRIALSGTPIENRLDELWSLFHFTNRGLLGSRADFEDRYGGPIANGDSAALARLRGRVRPFLLRRLKRDVAADLPPRTDLVLHCELSESERGVYDAVRAATRKQMVEALGEGGSGTLAALEALLRLRQAACHPALVPGQHAATSAKVERLVHALATAVQDGHRALVFSQWTSLLDLLEPALEQASIPFSRLDGQTRDRGAVVREFQGEGGPPVLIASLKAGGTGLNLTAADHVFLLDPWWNPSVEDQAADRAHRIGQSRPVLLYRLVATDTVEERILALQARKRAIADAVLEGGLAQGALTREDLLALVE